MKSMIFQQQICCADAQQIMNAEQKGGVKTLQGEMAEQMEEGEKTAWQNFRSVLDVLNTSTAEVDIAMFIQKDVIIQKSEKRT